MKQSINQKILWVDDTFVNELHEVMAYVDELKYSGGFDVVKIAHPDKAADILEKGEEEFACIILDIMMPYGTRLGRAETDSGLLTGTVLARKIREKDGKYQKYQKVPIVLLTGVRQVYEILTKNENGFPCLFKANVSAEEFLEAIKNAIENHDGGNHE